MKDSDGTSLAESSGGFRVASPPLDNDLGELLILPLVTDFREVELPAAGRYQVVVDLTTEGIEETALAFRAESLSEASRP